MRSEEVEVGMRVMVDRSYWQVGGQVGEVTATFGHSSYLAVDLLLDDGRSELVWARSVWPMAEEHQAAG